MKLKGFTLLEILIAMAILGIMASVSFAFFKTFSPALKLSSSVRDLATDIRYAQQLAVTEQVNHGVSFSSITDEYWIIKYGNGTTTLSHKSLPDGISFQEITGFVNDEAIFNPYGAVEQAGDILINIEDKVKTIMVRPSGFVKIK